jgi:hypothetical protein
MHLNPVSSWTGHSEGETAVGAGGGVGVVSTGEGVGAGPAGEGVGGGPSVVHSASEHTPKAQVARMASTSSPQELPQQDVKN